MNLASVRALEMQVFASSYFAQLICAKGEGSTDIQSQFFMHQYYLCLKIQLTGRSICSQYLYINYLSFVTKHKLKQFTFY